MSFASLGLSEELLHAVAAKGYEQASPIQAKSIPATLSGKDVLAAAQTGTGKTAAFTLPILQRLSEIEPKHPKAIRCLIITPTRELAAQVGQSVVDYGKNLNLKSCVVFGGVNINPQKATLRQGVDILVATPGRLLDLQSQKALSLAHVEILVLDEADRMLDMGFIHDIKRVLKLLPKKRQNLLFSATFSPEIRELTQNILVDPVSVEVAAENAAADTVEQEVYHVEKSQKLAMLKNLIEEGSWQQVLVFSRTKHGADKLCKKLDKGGIPSAAIHGNKSQNARTRALDNFKKMKIQVLVATDIAARGIDIKELPHVVNFDLPQVPEDYVHRIGRTGRAGSAGHAVSIICDDELKLFKRIEKLIGRQLKFEKTPRLPDVVKPDQQRAQSQRDRSGHGADEREDRSSRPSNPKRRTPSRRASTESGSEAQSRGFARGKKRPAGARSSGQGEGRNSQKGSSFGGQRSSSSPKRTSNRPARTTQA